MLYELEKNARQPLQSIARKVGLSKQLISYMMKKYEKQKIVLGYTAIIDSSRLGYYMYRVYLKFRGVNAKEGKEKIFTSLVDTPETIIVNEIEGRWDVGMVIAVKNVFDFYAVWNRLMQHRSSIDESKIAIYSPVSHFTRSLLSPTTDKEKRKVMVLGGHEPVEYQEVDILILQELAKNVRRPIVELAVKLKKSAQFVARRIKYLEKSGVIQGYRPLFDWSGLGYKYYKIDLRLSSYQRNNEMFSYCQYHPNVIQVNQTIGGSDFEFEIFARGDDDFRVIMEAMESRFANVIINYEYFTVTKPYKETFMAF